MTARTVEERLEAIERELLFIKARQGTVQLGTATLSLLWAVMVACLACVVFIVRMEGKVEAYAKVVAEDHSLFDTHRNAPGHSVELERIDEVKRRLQSIESNPKKEVP